MDTTINDAAAQVAAAIEAHGEPKWLAHVPFRVRRLVPAEVKQSLVAGARVSDGWARQGDQLVFGRPDQGAVLRQWAAGNVFAIMTVREIAEAAEVTQTAVRKLIAERPDILRKSDGRTYEVRDPQADRAAEKGR